MNKKNKESASVGPMAGIKVLELGTLIAGPFCARMLAEFGAEVINGKRPKVYQINIETSAPYDVTVDEVYNEACAEGLRKAIEIATKYRECEQTGVFSGVRDYIARMTLPEWYKETLDMSGSIPFGELED